MSLSSVMIHDVKGVTLSDERKIKKTGQWVRHLLIEGTDGSQTRIDLFAEHGGRLRVVPK